ncbi:uncharacterized protein LOC113862407 [Abrus precatorius]|uniref:Uncharacterized protein LOC113862407 n=1 Tax=Abrus precatorius TaxID=3816 RepID=A0A8B8L524_ABRPR|nr:uncharacterized protein LOC113862407 [Abrus precatorius]
MVKARVSFRKDKRKKKKNNLQILFNQNIHRIEREASHGGRGGSFTIMARYQGPNLCCFFFHDELPPSQTLGILAFDAAKTMCRLVSLYNSLSDAEILKLRRHVIRSKSVSHLNSRDECFLLNLACAEHLDDLNLTAAAVSRLARNCSDKDLARIDALFADLSHGVADLRKFDFGARHIERKIDDMEKLVAGTRNLHLAMESLSEMEASEKKIQRWRTIRANHGLMVKVECFDDKIMFFRRQVQYYKQVSLWNQTFDKVVGLMAKIICVVYARVRTVFGSVVTGVIPGLNNHKNKVVVRRLFRPNLENCCCRIEHRELYMTNLCLFNQNDESLKKGTRNACHVLKGTGTAVTRLHGEESGFTGNNRVLRLAPASTVGGVGLSLRYANLILLTERCMHVGTGIGDDMRVAVYEMLPERLKVKLKAKLRNEWMKWEGLEEGEEVHVAVAARWRDVLTEVLERLLPVAHDMVRWQAERNLEKQKLDTKPTVLLLQTLHYSNLDKVEEAIVEMLVGLSCVFWYRKQSNEPRSQGGERPCRRNRVLHTPPLLHFHAEDEKDCERGRNMQKLKGEALERGRPKQGSRRDRVLFH